MVGAALLMATVRLATGRPHRSLRGAMPNLWFAINSLIGPIRPLISRTNNVRTYYFECFDQIGLRLHILRDDKEGHLDVLNTLGSFLPWVSCSNDIKKLMISQSSITTELLDLFQRNYLLFTSLRIFRVFKKSFRTLWQFFIGSIFIKFCMSSLDSNCWDGRTNCFFWFAMEVIFYSF